MESIVEPSRAAARPNRPGSSGQVATLGAHLGAQCQRRAQPDAVARSRQTWRKLWSS